MKIRHPFLIRLAGFLIAVVLWLWLRTLRYRIYYEDPICHGDRWPKERFFLYCFWHETLLVPSYRFRRRDYHVLISEHADGEMIARAVQHLGHKTIRGSVTRGAARATREMLRTASEHDVVIMTDGPRGPRRRVKPGVVFLASRTGSPVVPAGCAFSRGWRARSWDRTFVPRPFSTAIMVVTRPMPVPPDLTGRERAAYCDAVQEQMDRATILAERIAAKHA